MISLLVLACSGGDPTETADTDRSPSSSETTPPTTTSPPPSEPRAVLASPAQAADTDPDPGVVHVQLTAAEHGDGYAYDGQVPGPTIRATVGDRLVVDLTNDLPDPTTIHWHGLSVPFAMDGVTWVEAPIASGATFRYEFPLTQAGTFWYHPHFDTERQVDLGLYGVLVVEDPADPPTDSELVVVLDVPAEVKLANADPHLVDPTGEVTLNGWVDPEIEVPAGSTVRVRLVNASGSRVVWLRDVEQVGSDQGLLPALHAGDVVVAPGDRVDLQWRVAGSFELMEAPYAVAGGPAFGDDARLLSVRATGSGQAPPTPDWGFDGALPSADPGVTDLRLLFTGSPERGWEINGETFPDVTVPTIGLDSEVVLEVRNVSPAEHPFHLHGHHFEVLSLDGAAPAVRTIEDTVQIGIGGVARLRFVADNPGFWMTHCHVLPHADEGMMTVLEVR
ncbi:MAG: multicopper oxidase family protein [Myxococcales bacterium]|nr:multicopper oxidase family protein [Myxococcales bacterium]